MTQKYTDHEKIRRLIEMSEHIKKVGGKSDLGDFFKRVCRQNYRGAFVRKRGCGLFRTRLLFGRSVWRFLGQSWEIKKCKINL